MKRHTARDPDAEIAQLQQRIRLGRIALILSVRTTQQALRARLTSPAMLLTAAGTGFVLGSVTKRGRGAASVPSRWWGFVIEAASAALKIASSGPAMWVATVLGRSTNAQRAQSQDLSSVAPR
jgi:hypothetical protein